jgi:hypothetical protein
VIPGQRPTRIAGRGTNLALLNYRAPGEAVALRQFFRGRIWNAVPAIVVEDRADLTVLWLPPNTTGAMGDDLFGDWKLHDRVFEMSSGQLRLTRPRERFSLFLFRHADGSFRGWYVNLEQPQTRTPLGFDFEDELLDIWIEPGSAPRWLDEDEVEEAVRRGFFSPERAAEIRAHGERVLADPPWPTGWEDWRPEPGWQRPLLPPGWDLVES